MKPRARVNPILRSQAVNRPLARAARRWRRLHCGQQFAKPWSAGSFWFRCSLLWNSEAGPSSVSRNIVKCSGQTRTHLPAAHFFGWDYLAEPHIRVFISIVLVIMTRQMTGGLRNLVLLNVQALNRLPWPWNGTLRCRNSLLSIVINSLMEGHSFIQQAFAAWVLCQAGL